MAKFFFPKRMIHLDFHTGPAIPDVARDFDADAFARTFKDAHVDSVTVFAKCHHGLLYYDTDNPARHSGLPKGLDLLGEQIEALNRHGIRAPVYISIQVDELAANMCPDWVAVDAEGRQVKRGGPLDAGWYTLDMSSPYQDYVMGQIDEVLQKYGPLDGLFLDMCWDQPSCSVWAIEGMENAGLDPRDEADRQRYARQVAHGYMGRFKKLIDDAHKGKPPAKIWFNSRPKTNLNVEKKYLRHIEVECLPTGGWGYAYFPYVARYVRPMKMPTLSHTGRFHRSWGDFGGIKPAAALKYECCLILSQGMTSGIGDQLHPRGTLDKAAYDLIGKVYGYIEQCEPWVEGGKLQSQIGVVVNPELGDNPGADGLGVVRALQQLRHQFDLVPPEADLSGYELVILTDSSLVDAALAKRLRQYLKRGGALLVSGAAALDEEGGALLPELGIEPHGPSLYTTTYMRPARGVAPELTATDHVMYEPGLQMTAAKGAKVLCRVVEPYFERDYAHFCSHNQTPPADVSRYALAVQQGRAITFSVPIFRALANHASPAYRTLIGACIDRLLPEPLLRDGGPAHLEATVLARKRRTVVHLISYCPTRQTEDLDIVEDPFPLVDMPLAVKLDRAPRRVLQAPEGKPLAFEYRDGYAHVLVTELDGHTMMVFE